MKKDVLERKYGITVEQWDRLYNLQGGICPICEKPVYRRGTPGKRASPIDHDHRSGRVRGIIHFGCNRFYVARNTIETAKKLVEYLESEIDGRAL